MRNGSCRRRSTAKLGRKYFLLFIDANAVNSARKLPQSKWIYTNYGCWVHFDRDKSRPTVEVFIAINWITAGGRVMSCTFSRLYFHFKIQFWFDVRSILHTPVTYRDACRCADATTSYILHMPEYSSARLIRQMQCAGKYSVLTLWRWYVGKGQILWDCKCGGDWRKSFETECQSYSKCCLNGKENLHIVRRPIPDSFVAIVCMRLI